MITLRGTVVNGHGEIVGGGLTVDDEGRLTAIAPVDDAPADRWITPGLVDVHNHGGGGTSFPDHPTPDTIRTAVNAHRRTGTTALVASLVSMADPLPEIEALVDACERGDLAGIHLEGPYISPCRPGAQNPAVIRDPDIAELTGWLQAGRGWIRTMTLAPENPLAHGPGSAAHVLLDHGALPSWGHTDATGEQARAALDDTADYARAIGWSGVPQTATHLFNCMPGIAHRAPGPIREFLRAAADGHCVVELIGDGVHVAPPLVADLLEMLDGCHGAALITDAMAGAGMADGAYSLGGLDVEIRDGVACLTGTSTIAGSTARLSDEFAVLVAGGHAPLARVVRAAVLAPARAVGLGGFGAHRGTTAGTGVTVDFVVGEKVNAVEFDADFRVLQVVHEGTLVG